MGLLGTVVKSKGAALLSGFDDGPRAFGRKLLTTAQTFNPLNFHIDGRASLIADPQRQFMFNVIILGVKEMAPKATTFMWANDLLLRCQKVSIPQVVIDTIDSEFYGALQSLPGKKHTGGDVKLNFYETEDQFITRCLYEWAQNTVKTNPDFMEGNQTSKVFKRTTTDTYDVNWGGNATKDVDFSKSGYATDMIVQMFHYDGTPMPYSFKLCNCWIKDYTISELTFDHGMVTYDATFRCDYWILLGPYFTSSYDTSNLAGSDILNWGIGQL